MSTDYPRVRAHIWVWINERGKIPPRMHIHHIDENKSNNHISNLQIISPGDHARLHYTEEKRQASRKLMDVIRPLTKKWHASKEGREWHREHAIKCNFGKHEIVDYACAECNKEFKASKLSWVKFCSNACKSTFRRKSGIDDIEVKCENCETTFIRNKYARKRFCSRKCSAHWSKSKINQKD